MLITSSLILSAACITTALGANKSQQVQTQYANSSSSARPSASDITLNAVNAVFEWWYSTTITATASTVLIQFDTDDNATGWTLLAPSTPFDPSSAISTYACASQPAVYTADDGKTYSYTTCSDAPVRVAASTTALILDAFIKPSKTTGTDPSKLPQLSAPTPAAHLIVPGASTTIFPGTPFVFFTAYEIVDGVSVTTSQLPSPYVFHYSGPDPAKQSVSATITGQLDSAFPSFVQQPSAIAGTWAAPPTVIVTVVRIIVAEAVLAAHIEQSASALVVPTAHIEGSATTLVAPTVRHTSTYTNLAALNGQSRNGATRSEGGAANTGSDSSTSTNEDGLPGSYIATVIGVTRPGDSTQTGLAMTQQTGESKQGTASNPSDQANSASQTGPQGQLGSGAATTSRQAYTPGSTASSLSISVCVLLCCVAGVIFALATS